MANNKGRGILRAGIKGVAAMLVPGGGILGTVVEELAAAFACPRAGSPPPGLSWPPYGLPRSPPRRLPPK